MADGGSERLTLRLAEKLADDEAPNVEVDLGDEGFSVGDYFVIAADPVYNRARTRQVGVARGHCMLAELRGQQSGSYECDVTFDLDRGDIAVESGFTFAGQEFDAELAVVGGTGAYKTAHGTLTVTADAERLLFLFKLIL